MVRKIGFLISIVVFSWQSYSQCSVNYKVALSGINEGTYLTHREIDNRDASEISFILNSDLPFSIYLLNASKEISNYELVNITTSATPLKIEEKTNTYLRYSISVNEIKEYKFKLKVKGAGKACVLIALYYQSNNKEQIKLFAKSNAKTPPGTVKVGESLFFDKCEITNINWREFTSWQKRFFGKESMEYKNALPDTLVWKLENQYNEPLANLYFWHPAYRNYPIVGVSYEQAKTYCKWRSDRVNEQLYLKRNKDIYDANSITKLVPVVYEYRLPTEKEWELMASFDVSSRVKKKIDKSGKANDNFYSKSRLNLNDKALFTSAVMFYNPNEIGLYNMLGNVAEMVSQEGVAKGGSWRDTASEINAKTKLTYTTPTCWLGFRCVCEKK